MVTNKHMGGATVEYRENTIITPCGTLGGGGGGGH